MLACEWRGVFEAANDGLHSPSRRVALTLHRIAERQMQSSELGGNPCNMNATRDVSDLGPQTRSSVGFQRKHGSGGGT